MKETISKKQLKEFGYLIGFAFPLLIGWLIPFFSGHTFRLWTLFIGIPGLTFAIISPQLLYYPYRGWMTLGLILGWLNSRVILGLIFIFVLQPISYTMHLFGYDPLRKKRKGKDTYKEKRKTQNIDLTRIF